MFYVEVENLFTLSIIKNVVNTCFSINAVNVVKTPSNKLARSIKTVLKSNDDLKEVWAEFSTLSKAV